MTITVSTATGRRLGARSPRLLTNGTANSAAMSTSGKIRMMKVSVAGGLSDNSAKSHKNGHSGRGFAPPAVGSGDSLGPLGPMTAASATTTITASAEKNMSLSIASPRNGTPDLQLLFVLGVVDRADRPPGRGPAAR